MTYLLDTAFVSELGRTSPDPGVVEWLGRQRRSDMAISSLTVAEISRGIARLGTTRRAAALAAWFDEALAGELFERILPFSVDEARAWGDLRARLDRAGQPLPVIDSLIAATALAHDLTVVTRNVRDFERWACPCSVPGRTPDARLVLASPP